MLASVKGGNFLFECWIWLESWCMLPVNTVSWAGQVENVWGKRQGSEGLVQNSLFSFCFPNRLQTRCVSCPLGLIFNCGLIHFFGERWWCAGFYTHLKSPRFDFWRRYTFVAVFIFVFCFWLPWKNVSLCNGQSLVLLIVLYLFIPLYMPWPYFKDRALSDSFN